MMNGVIPYSAIADLTVQEAAERIIASEKVRYGSLTMEDMVLNGNPGAIAFYDLHKEEYYGQGIYIMFDGNTPVYVGKAKKHFLHRFQSHLYYDPRPNWDWNKLVRSTANRKLSNYSGEYNYEEYRQALDIVLSYNVIRLNTFGVLEIGRLSRLESIIMKALNQSFPNDLLNDRIGRMPSRLLYQTLSNLMNL
ncbi:hypothetical protein [Pontibacter kalidii]|uniref:hypothetical protein n=1 Tax=Pontibacter kalidii TaxID=2592049 RepID=UPI00225690DD|nr:hypothetical protein [Pontibacter kalidii]